MTQTEDRIRELIVLSITPGDLHNPWSDAPRRLADTIAAEIDALTAQNAHLARLHSNVATMYLDAQAHIDAAAKRAEANAPKLIEMMEDKDKRIATLTAERDDAQRLIGIYSTSRDAVIAQLGEMNDALRAEVERLRTELAAVPVEALRRY